MNWYKNLPDVDRENLFAWMRGTDERAMADEARSRALEAPYGTIAVGAGAFDPWLKGETAQEYLRELRRGSNPSGALTAALAYARECVAKHNAKRPRDANWARWEGTADAGLEGLHRSLLTVLESTS